MKNPGADRQQREKPEDRHACRQLMSGDVWQSSRLP